METTSVGLLGASESTIKSAVGLAQNFNDFLTLLTTQLQNQDPMEPLDATQFTTQLVQFASVEQQLGQNARLDQLLKVQSGTQAVGAVSFLDTKVEAFGNTNALNGGTAAYTYTLPSAAASVTITVKDANGTVVYTGQGDKEAGKHSFVWDGKNNQGATQPDGNYSISIAARDQDGNALETSTGIVGQVSGVTVKDGVLVLDLGGVTVKVTDVVSVTKPQDPTGSQSS